MASSGVRHEDHHALLGPACCGAEEGAEGGAEGGREGEGVGGAGGGELGVQKKEKEVFGFERLRLREREERSEKPPKIEFAPVAFFSLFLSLFLSSPPPPPNRDTRLRSTRERIHNLTQSEAPTLPEPKAFRPNDDNRASAA